MKICSIRDEAARQQTIGYLFYYEKSGAFSIELSDTMTEEDVPVFFSSFIRQKTFTIDPEWSARWVQQRIVPTDRQNLGLILRENRLKEYDPYRLLLLGAGRCAQDDCMVVPVKEEQLPGWVAERRKKKLELAIALNAGTLFLVFRDGTIRKADVRKELQGRRRLQILLSRPDAFRAVRLLPGGNGVTWGEGLFLTAEALYQSGKKLPMEKEEFKILLKESVLDTSDICAELHCSRQYVNQLVQRKELNCLRENGSSRLYERGELERLKGQ